MITHQQRKAAFAMIKDIQKWIGYKSLTTFYDQLKNEFTKIMDYSEDKKFSLADGKCTSREYEVFMDWILDIYFETGVQSETNPKEYITDIEKYMTSCIKHRICAICGKPGADIHHVEKIGMGSNRYEVDHSRYKRQALSREYHQLCHMMGQEEFDKKYHIIGVKTHYHNNSIDRIDEKEKKE